MRHIFIIGSKGIPANYGGFETFVEKLTEYQVSKDIKYHVSCLSDHEEEFEYHQAHCFCVNVPDIGSARAVYYDIMAFRYCLKYIKNNNIKNAIVYVLACRIGPFIKGLKKQLNWLGGRLYVNPDGHEWKRSKWNCLIRKYWKISERLMVKHAQLLICDSKNIEKYIRKEYKRYHPKTTYIAYGCDMKLSVLSDNACELVDWYDQYGLKKKNYYLVVGRFVPENNYEVMIREFMKSNTKKDIVLITNIEKNKFYERLRKDTGFESDSRVKFVGTVYNQELLKKIRENAYGYLHGHSVGGTNPSLIEALGSTDINLLFDVGFNREVGRQAVFYWNAALGNLTELIEKIDNLDPAIATKLGKKAKRNMDDRFSWEKIIDKYERIFTNI